MTDRPDDAGSRPGSAPADGSTTGDGAGSSARSWVVPALLFVAGLLLGGVAVAAANVGSGDDDPLATPSVSPSPSPSPSPTPDPTGGPEDVIVRIPAPCVQVAQEADAAFDDVDAFAQAVRDFDARRLQEFLDRFQEVRPRIESLSEQCQNLASEGIVDGELITPTPAATS
jgi:hypothetical protein